ncbi:conserved hypothetical protein [Coccidioides posadasii str. Silveira]|uniref:Uncharacterized protein n=2 Tax=Coccidioides posadasii TaxID=199306 RepID=E9D682_COCPS|nr:conserved hypothetical protein [Coccidioides posadasii str. Silveira]KMM66192.1 hypothetical protein CPAG_02532 [Coccidioides posadasii RMSCC 3488]
MSTNQHQPQPPSTSASAPIPSHPKALEHESHQGQRLVRAEGGEPHIPVEISLDMSAFRRCRRGGSSEKENIDYKRIPRNEIPVSLSFFYGKPCLNAPQLEHVKYDSKADKDLFEKNAFIREKPIQSDNQDQDQREDCLSQLKELVSLAGSCNDDILSSWAGECVICDQAVALAAIHHPLCFTFDGYSSLADGREMHGMMVYIAKLVKELDTEGKIQNAVGNTSTTTNPHVHFLSAPLAQFAKNPGDIGDVDEGEAPPSKARDSKRMSKRESVMVDKWEDLDTTSNFEPEGILPISKMDVASSQPVNSLNRVPLRVVVFCGKPIIDTKATTSPSSTTASERSSKPGSWLVGNGCRWTAPATEAVLGSDGTWHVNLFVVPICRRDNVVCEEAARIAAKRFLDNQLVGIPGGTTAFKLAWPELVFDTNLSAIYTVNNAGKLPKMVVQKIGLGVMSDPKIETKAAKETRCALERLRLRVESDYNAHLQKSRENKERIEKESRKRKSRADLLEEDLIFTYAINPLQLPYELAPSEAVYTNHEEEVNTDDEDKVDEETLPIFEASRYEEEVLEPLLSPYLFDLRAQVGEFVKGRYGDDFLMKAVELET